MIDETVIVAEVTRVHANLEARFPCAFDVETTRTLVRAILAPTPKQLAERAALAQQLAALRT